MDRDPLDKIFFRSSARMIRDNNIHTGPAGGAHNPKETFTALRFGILSIQVRDHFQGVPWTAPAADPNRSFR